MRVTLVISALTAGGAERVMSTLANSWARLGWEVTLLTAAPPSAEPFYPLDERVRYRPLDLLRRSGSAAAAVRNNLRYISTLRGAIRQSSPTIVISFITECNVRTLLAAWGLQAPVIVSERNDPMRYAARGVWSRLRKLLYRRAAAVVLQTEEARACFTELNDRILVIPNPVPKADGRRADPKASRTVVSIGRLVRQKGFDLLIAAFASLAERHPEWKLRILGEGPLRPELEKLIDSFGLRGRVELPGVVQDVAAELRQAALFVASSRWEGFPNALCEAMAAGLPAVATSCSAGPRQIVLEGKNGYLVAPESPQALAAKMGELMESASLRERLGTEATKITQRFGEEQVLAQWEAAIARALGRPSAATERVHAEMNVTATR